MVCGLIGGATFAIRRGSFGGGGLRKRADRVEARGSPKFTKSSFTINLFNGKSKDYFV